MLCASQAALERLRSADLRDDSAPPRDRDAGRGTGVHFPPSRWRDDQNRRDDGKFHGRNNRGPRKHDRFAAKPLDKGGSWSQSRKHFGAHSFSFHVLSKAFVPECARCRRALSPRALSFRSR
ncbi:hypothetical protein CYMTET_15795 [Cymbomonas tetramitiformis]|uniref:Uncharacterized protein n=1 Tax=Cymbomonas tetramitiformis TaxID=36881 RepID=A0AAE0GDV4_9CHLO|nr:hypothetical protein CYMTET_15795 [Cymbomonas tetramitiformis]